MTPKEKNKATIVTTLIVCGFILFMAGAIYLTDEVDPLIWVIIFALVEMFYAVPLLNYGYYKLWKVSAEGSAYRFFIPVYNYTVCVKPYYAWGILISFITFLLITVSMYFPNIYSIFGESFMLNLEEWYPKAVLITFVITNFIIGLGLYDVGFQISRLYTTAIPSESPSGILKALDIIFRLVPFLNIILMILPVVRVLPILIINDRATTLNKLDLNFTNVETNER